MPRRLVPDSLDSDVVLDLPGHGNNKAFGHCGLDFVTRVGLCTFEGGTGKFTHFRATAHVSIGMGSLGLGASTGPGTDRTA